MGVENLVYIFGLFRAFQRFLSVCVFCANGCGLREKWGEKILKD